MDGHGRITGVVRLMDFIASVILLWNGIGVWGLNKTVGWAWDITNFVWWVGIGHAGTLISAILLLFRQKMENVYQPRCGSDDDLCRYLCRDISVSCTWAVCG